MKFLTKHKEIIILFIVSLAFFYVYSFGLGFEALTKFNSPDETANYFWTERFSQGSSLSYSEPLNTIANDLLRPRSVNVVGPQVVPGSFLGLPIIYGSIAKVLTAKSLPFLTPFFACLAVIFFYLILSYLFNKKIALIAAILLFFFPGWWYYAARGMYHQVLFISLFFISLYLLIVCLKHTTKEKIINTADQSPLHIHVIPSPSGYLKEIYPSVKFILYFLSGLLLGLAIITRTSEIVWLALTPFILLAVNFRKIIWPGFFLYLTGLGLGLLPMFYFNQILYGSFISAGYTTDVGQQSIANVISSGTLFKMLITPFGLDLKSILTNGFNYLFKFLPLWSIPAILGFILFLFLPQKISNIRPRKKLLLTAYCLLLTVYLLVFYGSWSITDRIDESTFSLGTSYLRYWLPIYLLLIPFISFLVYWFSRLFKYTWLQFIVIFFMVLFLFIPSANLVMTDTDESLINIRQSVIVSQNKLKLIQQRIPNSDAVIITYKQADKIFFSEYTRLITDLIVPADYLAVARLAKLTHIYYYTFAPFNTVEYISKRDFEQYGLKIEHGKKIYGSDYLYQINHIQPVDDINLEP